MTSLTMVNVFNELFHVVDKVALSEIELTEIGTCPAILNVLIFDWHMWVFEKMFQLFHFMPWFSV